MSPTFGNFDAAESPEPLLVLGAIHYKHVTDLAWSHDGRYLLSSSGDGYCSLAAFKEGELGRPLYMAHTLAEKLRREIACKRQPTTKNVWTSAD